MKKGSRMSLYSLFVICTLLLYAVQVQALSLTPASSELVLSSNTNDQDGIMDEIDDYFLSIYGVDSSIYPVELYKAEADPFAELGLLAGSYDTTFIPTTDEASGATIVNTGGPIVGADAYLLVKDGQMTPAYYFFNLTSWDGIETINLSGFWPDSGAISNVVLFGKEAPIPEPGTMLLFGTGLAGLAAVGRRRKN